MTLHFFARLVPKPGNADAFRKALLEVLGPTREEPGCVGVRVFESHREPVTFQIHAEWLDEDVFDHHLTLPHTVRFLSAASELLTEPVQGLRTTEIGAIGVSR